MSARTAIVVGGGIGGLAGAIALARTGWRVRLLEQAPRLRALGAGIGLTPNGVRAMEWLGLGDPLRARGIAQGSAGIRVPSGRWLMRTRLTELVDRFGVPGYALHRADLHQILTAGLATVAVSCDHRAVGVDSILDGARVRYEAPDGPGSAVADLVVVADGVHSRLRVALFPDHPRPAYARYFTWRGIVPASNARDIPRETGLAETWGRGRRFGIAPLPAGQVAWFATMSAPEGSHAGDTLADLAGHFRGWHAPIPQVLAATPPEALLRHDIYHLANPLPSYVRGRVALVGDAAHPVTPDLGQGACLALEGAVTLAGLAATEPDLAAALAAYDHVHLPRAHRMARASAAAGRIAQWRNPAAATARNALAWLTPASAYLRSAGDTYSWTPSPSWPPQRAH